MRAATNVFPVSGHEGDAIIAINAIHAPGADGRRKRGVRIERLDLQCHVINVRPI